jgi:hypothetical protein
LGLICATSLADCIDRISAASIASCIGNAVCTGGSIAAGMRRAAVGISVGTGAADRARAE